MECNVRDILKLVLKVLYRNQQFQLDGFKGHSNEEILSLLTMLIQNSVIWIKNVQVKNLISYAL